MLDVHPHHLVGGHQRCYVIIKKYIRMNVIIGYADFDEPPESLDAAGLVVVAGPPDSLDSAESAAD